MPEISSHGFATRNLVLIILISIAGIACQAPERPSSNEPPLAPTSSTDSASRYHPSVALGELFGQIQMNQIFDDGKTLVDSLPKEPPQQILQEYHNRHKLPDFDLVAFTEQYLTPPPSVNSSYRTETGMSMETHVGLLWDHLTRQADSVVPWSSLIELPYPYVVPGGRFREIYYWDTYFTMQGLVANGRLTMVKSLLDNFAWLIDSVGHIPNGNRTYYLSRSQPPFFSAMIALYATQVGTSQAVRYLPYLETEYQFWMAGQSKATSESPVRRVVRMPDNALLNRYYDDLDTPRPESYREDVMVAREGSRIAQSQTFRDLRAAAESGWDFSSRWLKPNAGLSSIHTTDIIPIDLNSLLYHMELSLSELNRAAGQEGPAREYAELALNRKNAIRRWLWDDERNIFADFNWRSQTLTSTESLAMVYPLYFELATPEQAEAVARFLKDHLLMSGGLVTTLNATGEQWDYPNGWAPLQWLSIRGLQNYGYDQFATDVTNRWLNLNRRVFNSTGRMMEKYNVVDIELPAGGGEYPLQDGFGWTNGVAEALLQTQ